MLHLCAQGCYGTCGSQSLVNVLAMHPCSAVCCAAPVTTCSQLLQLCGKVLPHMLHGQGTSGRHIKLHIAVLSLQL